MEIYLLARLQCRMYFNVMLLFLPGARSHDNLQREDPYASFRGSGGPHGHPPPHHQPGPQSHMPQSASYYSIQGQQHRDPAREQALRSKSTSQLDRHEPSDAPYRQVTSLELR